MLLGILVFGLIGTAVGLLFLGHDESLTQLVPLVLIATGIAVITRLYYDSIDFKPRNSREQKTNENPDYFAHARQRKRKRQFAA
jgi:hypothetical protein